MTLEKAIKTALEYEEKVRDIYYENAKKFRSETAQKIFTVLGDEEQKHVDYLEAKMKEWQDTSMDSAKPSAEQSTSRPCKSSPRAHAIECSRKSRRPHCSSTARKTASSSPGLVTLHGRKIRAPSCCASGSTNRRALSLRYVTATSAPAA